MLNFSIDKTRCIKCGKCGKDCPARIIEFENKIPFIAAANEESCYKCQHCLAICPSGALSILNKKPEDSILLKGNIPGAKQMETLIKGRRSVRSYIDENLDPAVINKLLEVVSHAPTGVNAQKVLFTVISNRETMAKFRLEVMSGLKKLADENKITGRLAFFAGIVKSFYEKGEDILFRGAPHLIITSAPPDCPTPEADLIIALSYFELYAQSLGLGTLWDGMVKWAVKDLLPNVVQRLGIPGDHNIGYILLFGKPAVEYARTVQRTADNLRLVSSL